MTQLLAVIEDHRLIALLVAALCVVIALYLCVPDEIPQDWSRQEPAPKPTPLRRHPTGAVGAPHSRKALASRLRAVRSYHHT